VAIEFISVGTGDIVKHGESVGVVLDVTTDNPSPSPGCLVKWLIGAPYDDSDQDWVLMNMLEVLREA
jgi:hypothetical protein